MKYIDADKLKKEIYIIWENEAINHDVEALLGKTLFTIEHQSIDNGLDEIILKKLENALDNADDLIQSNKECLAYDTLSDCVYEIIDFLKKSVVKIKSIDSGKSKHD